MLANVSVENELLDRRKKNCRSFKHLCWNEVCCSFQFFVSCHLAFAWFRHDNVDNGQTINLQITNNAVYTDTAKLNFYNLTCYTAIFFASQLGSFLHCNWVSLFTYTVFTFRSHIYIKKNFFFGSRQYHNFFMVIFFTTSIYLHFLLFLTRCAHI